MSLSLVGLNLVRCTDELRVERPDLVSKSLLATHRPVAAPLPRPSQAETTSAAVDEDENGGLVSVLCGIELAQVAPSAGMDGTAVRFVEASTAVAGKLLGSTKDLTATGEKISREEQKRRRKASLTAADHFGHVGGTKEHPGRCTTRERGSIQTRPSAHSQGASSSASCSPRGSDAAASSSMGKARGKQTCGLGDWHQGAQISGDDELLVV